MGNAIAILKFLCLAMAVFFGTSILGRIIAGASGAFRGSITDLHLALFALATAGFVCL